MNQANPQENGNSQPPINFGKLSGIQSLPPFPAVAAKLLGVISDEDAGFREMSSLILKDTGLSGQVLRLANSSLFGFRQEVRSVLKALCLMGANRVRDMVVTAALKNYMGSGLKSHLRDSWRHSLATALWAEALAQMYGADVSTAYTAGLLHDLGRIALFRLTPDIYASYLEKAAEIVRADFRSLELEMFGVDHCQAGAYLSRVWKFQPTLTEIIGHHHDPITADSSHCLAFVEAACSAARMSGFCAAGPSPDWDGAQLAGLLPPPKSSRPTPLDEIRQQVSHELNLIECSLL